jgi:hypothetical protein
VYPVRQYLCHAAFPKILVNSDTAGRIMGAVVPALDTHPFPFMQDPWGVSCKLLRGGWKNAFPWPYESIFAAWTCAIVPRKASRRT